MDNADVIEMVRAGLRDVDVIAAIRNAFTQFQLAPSDVMALIAAGVSGEVIRAMLTSAVAADQRAWTITRPD